MPENILKISMAAGEAVETEQSEAKDGWLSKPWRLLSAGMHWLTGPFGDGILVEYPADVLQAAVEKYSGIPLHVDHDARIPTWLGKIEQPVWREETDGIPAGINAIVKVSEKRDQELKSGAILGITEGVISKGSIGQKLRVDQSHDFDDHWQFVEMMGREVDGEIVRYIAKEIVEVLEFSLVASPADPNATIQTKLNKTEKKEDGMNKEFLIQMAKVLGLPNTASESEILAAAKASREQANAFTEQLEEIRTRAQANLEALKAAGKELNPLYGDMLKSDDPKTIKFVASELEAKLEAAIPPKGRASEQTVATEASHKIHRSVDNPKGW